ncbi:MAG: hypothetical protein OSJ54_06020 [Oscillospiraceae bacterium]|nr:hypothetical protein [Oscillospiraceae bacterium]
MDMNKVIETQVNAALDARGLKLDMKREGLQIISLDGMTVKIILDGKKYGVFDTVKNKFL